MLTSFAYFTVSPPIILARRYKGKTYHEGWSFRNEYTTGWLKYTLASGDYKGWRRLMSMGKWVGVLRARQIQVKKVKKDSIYAYWVSLKDKSAAENDCVLLYFHGGGFVTGNPMMHAVAYQKLLLTLKEKHSIEGIKIFTVKYPLAPENCYPTQTESALNAYKYLVDICSVNPSNILVGGDSAGGNLALVLMQKLQELQLELPKALLLTSPWVEMVVEIPSHATKADTRRDYLSPRCAKPFVESFIGNSGIAISDPRVSPINADLSGYPPMMICWGGVELFREQILEFSEKAQAAGVDVTAYVDPDMPHVFAMLLDFYPVNAKKAIARIARWVAEIVQDKEEVDEQLENN